MERTCGFRRRALGGCGILLALLLGSSDPAAAPGETLVSAAVSLRPALTEAAATYRAEHGGPEIRINTGASGLLLQQIRRGAPVDLFVSASSREIDALEVDGRVRPGSRVAVASNRLVVLVPAGERAPEELAALADPGFGRVAIGNPKTAPVGRYAERALRELGLWDALEPRLVFAENARQTLEYVARGEVSAGVLYRSDARIAAGRVELGPEIPAAAHPAIRYEAAVIDDAPHPDAALAFLHWLVSDAGRKILARHGFLPPHR